METEPKDWYKSFSAAPIKQRLSEIKLSKDARRLVAGLINLLHEETYPMQFVTLTFSVWGDVTWGMSHREPNDFARQQQSGMYSLLRKLAHELKPNCSEFAQYVEQITDRYQRRSGDLAAG